MSWTHMTSSSQLLGSRWICHLKYAGTCGNTIFQTSLFCYPFPNTSSFHFDCRCYFLWSRSCQGDCTLKRSLKCLEEWALLSLEERTCRMRWCLSMWKISIVKIKFVEMTMLIRLCDEFVDNFQLVSELYQPAQGSSIFASWYLWSIVIVLFHFWSVSCANVRMVPALMCVGLILFA